MGFLTAARAEIGVPLVVLIDLVPAPPFFVGVDGVAPLTLLVGAPGDAGPFEGAGDIRPDEPGTTGFLTLVAMVGEGPCLYMRTSGRMVCSMNLSYYLLRADSGALPPSLPLNTVTPRRYGAKAKNRRQRQSGGWLCLLHLSVVFWPSLRSLAK